MAAEAAEGEVTPIGKLIEKFELSDYLGARHSLNEWKEKKAVVVVFVGTECPLAKVYGRRLAELAERYEPKGVQFVAINSNQQNSLAEIAHFAQRHKIDFPILKDPGGSVADQFGAVRTPEAFLLDERRVVRYWGAIDDQYGVGYARAAVEKEYLAGALDICWLGGRLAGRRCLPSAVASGAPAGASRPAT